MTSIGEFRNSLKKWERFGWRIDMKKMEEASGDVAFAIPCPDRRNSKNWVLESVPLKKNI